MKLIRKFVAWLLSVPEGERSKWNIILWWELRRIPYNIIVGVVGICSVTLLYLLTAHEPMEDGQDIVEPMFLWMAPFFLNAGYTLGWIVEAFAPKAYLESFPGDDRKIGPRFLWFGLRLTLFVELAPTVLWTGLWFLRAVGLRT